MDHTSSLRTYSKKERNLYLIGLAGQNVIYSASTVLAYYYQFTLLIPAMAVSLILSLNQILDAIKDPLMGNIMDHTRSKWGKARPYVLFTPIPIGILLILCFINHIYDPAQPMGSGQNLFVILWASLSYFLFGLAFSASDIPLHSLPNLMTEDENDRTKIISLKTTAMLIGMLGMVVQPLSIQVGKIFARESLQTQRSEQLGFFLVVSIFSVIGSALFQLTGLFVKEHISLPKGHVSVKENFKLMWENKPFRAVLLSGILASPKAVETVGAMPLFTYYYANKDPLKIILYTIIISGGSYLGRVIASNIVPLLSKKYEKVKLFIFSNLMSAIPMLIVFLLFLFNPFRMANVFLLVLTALCYTISGTLTAIQSIVATLFISDAVDYEEYQTGRRPDGTFVSGQTITTKLSSGISSLIGGSIYALAGFSDQRIAELNTFIAGGGMVKESLEFTSDMRVLFFLATIPTVIGAILCIIPMIKYPLTDATHEQILKNLNLRRHVDQQQKNENDSSEPEKD